MPVGTQIWRDKDSISGLLGHSGPHCHALSLSSSSSSWTLHAACAIAIAGVLQQRHLVNGNVTAARRGEWAQHFSNASCLRFLMATFFRFAYSEVYTTARCVCLSVRLSVCHKPVVCRNVQCSRIGSAISILFCFIGPTYKQVNP